MFAVLPEAAPALHCREPEGPAVPALVAVPGTSRCHRWEHGSQHPAHLLLHQLISSGVLCPGVQDPALPGECLGPSLGAAAGSCGSSDTSARVWSYNVVPCGQELLISVPKCQLGTVRMSEFLCMGLSRHLQAEYMAWKAKGHPAISSWLLRVLTTPGPCFSSFFAGQQNSMRMWCK